MGVGIMGKEGRQAVNNSDYAVAQFRFLTRLLLLHGSLSAYRLSRLIKYSFYKNIAFGGMLFFYQFYCGFSGQARPAAYPPGFLGRCSAKQLLVLPCCRWLPLQSSGLSFCCALVNTV